MNEEKTTMIIDSIVYEYIMLPSTRLHVDIAPERMIDTIKMTT